MDHVIARCEKLIALALNNPNEEEARSAALKALKMLQAHKLKITIARGPVAAEPIRREPDQQQAQYANQVVNPYWQFVWQSFGAAGSAFVKPGRGVE